MAGNRKENRSNKYQYILLESPFSPDILTEYADTEGVFIKDNPELIDELIGLKEDLKNEFWRLVDQELTERQSEVLHLYAQGLTQIEIAKKLSVNQSSITKSMNGNTDYRSGRRVYGGSNKKMRRLAEKDQKIQAILKRIAEIHAELSEY